MMFYCLEVFDDILFEYNYYCFFIYFIIIILPVGDHISLHNHSTLTY